MWQVSSGRVVVEVESHPLQPEKAEPEEGLATTSKFGIKPLSSQSPLSVPAVLMQFIIPPGTLSIIVPFPVPAPRT
jgi:hypothetical protein